MTDLTKKEMHFWVAGKLFTERLSTCQMDAVENLEEKLQELDEQLKRVEKAAQDPLPNLHVIETNRRKVQREIEETKVLLEKERKEYQAFVTDEATRACEEAKTFVYVFGLASVGE